jgi:hypothetical protein
MGSKVVINCSNMTCTVGTPQHSNNDSMQEELDVVYAGHHLKIPFTAQRVKIPPGCT